MEALQLLAESDGVVSFNEATIVVAPLLSDVVSSGVDLSLFLLNLEGDRVVFSDSVLVPPEVSNEGPVLPLLSLGLPTEVEDLF